MVEQQICHRCEHEQDVDTEEFPINWKCEECYKINPYEDPVAVIWHCLTGTARKKKSYDD